MHNDPLQAASGGLSPDLMEGAAKGALKVSPAGILMFWQYVLDMPVEKWLTVAALVFTVLQIVALVRREFFQPKKKGGRK